MDAGDVGTDGRELALHRVVAPVEVIDALDPRLAAAHQARRSPGPAEARRSVAITVAPDR